MRHLACVSFSTLLLCGYFIIDFNNSRFISVHILQRICKDVFFVVVSERFMKNELVFWLEFPTLSEKVLLFMMSVEKFCYNILLLNFRLFPPNSVRILVRCVLHSIFWIIMVVPEFIFVVVFKKQTIILVVIIIQSNACSSTTLFAKKHAVYYLGPCTAFYDSCGGNFETM
mgnify:CR=1 FL=1